MRILCLCFYFEPDLSAGSFKNSALVKELGRQVTDDSLIDVVTTLPNRYAQFYVSAAECEQRDNIRVRRIQLPAHQSGMLDQSRVFASYAQEVLRITRQEQYDLVYASSSRLMMSVLGAWISERKRIPLYLDIRDLFVDTIKDVLPGRLATLAMPVLSRLEKWAVCRASRVNVVSGGFAPYFQQNFPGIELSHFTNGIDEEFLEAAPTMPVRITKTVPEVLYAGNMGQGQGLHHIIPLLAKHFEGQLTFRLVGSGGRLQELKIRLLQEGCTNVLLEDPVPREKLIELYQRADILFLHLNDFDAFKKVLPSKIFEYGALGKPVWAGVGGFSANFIREHISNSAVFPPCDIAGAVESFRELDMQTVPRAEFVSNFSRRHIIEHMAADMIGTITSR